MFVRNIEVAQLGVKLSSSITPFGGIIDPLVLLFPVRIVQQRPSPPVDRYHPAIDTVQNPRGTSASDHSL